MHRFFRVATFLKAYLLAKMNRYRNRQSLLRYQKKMFKSFEKRVLKNSWYYQCYIGKPLECYPIIDKKAHMGNFNTINTAHLDRDNALDIAIKGENDRQFHAKYNSFSVGLSSGTSGNRGLFVTSDVERTEWAAYILAKMLPRGIKKHRIAFFLRANNNLYETVNSQLIAFKFFDLVVPIEKHIDSLNRYQPTILIAPAQVLLALTGFQSKAGDGAQTMTSLAISPEKIISVAEVLDKRDKALIERCFKQQLHQVYQCTEGFLACTCQYGNLHLNEDIVIIEKEWIDRESGRFIPIVTDLRRTTQPIVRYRLDDILVIDNCVCPCGSPYTRLKAIEGRCDDVLKLPMRDGGYGNIFPDFLRNKIVGNHPAIEDYRVEQVGDKHLKIYITPFDESTVGELKKSLSHLWKTLGTLPPNCQFVKFENSGESEFLRKKRRVVRHYCG